MPHLYLLIVLEPTTPTHCRHDICQVTDGDGSVLMDKTCGDNTPATLTSNTERSGNLTILSNPLSYIILSYRLKDHNIPLNYYFLVTNGCILQGGYYLSVFCARMDFKAEYSTILS